ncbi:MAG TPA: hypothetical protein VFQ61_25680 [Polyangiaceae bacterium]|nr:hypothetical protein [Polyangiaceae bacterium]
MKRDAFEEEIAVNPGASIVVSADFLRLRLLPSGRPDRFYIGGDHPVLRQRLRIDRNPNAVRLALGSANHELPWPFREFLSSHGELRLHIPDGALLDVTASAGRISAEHLSGGLNIRSDAGRIDIHSFRGNLRIAASAGRIEGTELEGTIDVSSNAGAVRLEVVSLAPGEHRVQTNLGTARVDLPRGLPVAIEARTAMGSASIAFPSTPTADAVLKLSADLGSVSVRESARIWDPRLPPRVTAGLASRPVRVATAGFAEVSRPGQSLEAADREQALALRVSDEDWQRVQRRVTRGTLSPDVARELLRVLGHR